MKLDKAIDKCFDKCNLIGEEVDIFEVMMKYKAIRDVPDQWDAIYDDIAFRLGFIER